MDSVKLAKIEERQIAADRRQTDMIDQLKEFIQEQRVSNRVFWETKNKVDRMEARSGGIFWVFTVLGSLTVTTAVAASWLFEQRHAIMAWFKGGS